MKVIELLNKIAKGEEVPKKIKYNETDYFLYDNYSYLTFTKTRFFDSIYFKELNDEVEIIEDKKIEKYDTGLTNGRYTEDSIKTGLDTDTTIENIIINMGIEITLVKEKMFEIIDKINSMEVK